MEIRIFTLILLFSLSSCSIFQDRSKERKIQTEIISKINEKTEDFAKCTKKSDLFKKFDMDRIRVVLHISVNAQGQIEKFKLDDKNYPEEFSECIFKIADLIHFPVIKNHELIELEQPFIFSKK